uniref:Uncharacterized protein n=1 Tax=Salix viminalis TaxID=40686 RepID=A0A6N2K174_SALVM
MARFVSVKPSTNYIIHEIYSLDPRYKPIIVIQFPPIKVPIRQPVIFPASILVNKGHNDCTDVVPHGNF